MTSAVSLLEVVTAYFVDERGLNRKTAAVCVGIAIFLVGIPASLSLGPWSDVLLFGMTIFDLMDYVTANLLLPLGAIAISLFVGWVISLAPWKKRQAKERILSFGQCLGGLFPAMSPPLAIAWILIMGLRG